MVLAQLVDIMSGTPNSGFPARKLRRLTKAASLGGDSQSVSAPSAETSSNAGASTTAESPIAAKHAAGESEVLSASEEEPEV